MTSIPNKQWDRYFTPRKIIRDLVHGYINLTEFELEIIDKAPFQRLKDIRQLTCQQVYPMARHTRFEHSLGVMELTRRAIESLNQNGILTLYGKAIPQRRPISDKVRFNAILAALLHDVGHCPFSHLGEQQIDRMEVWDRLRYDVHQLLNGSELDQRFQKKKYNYEPDKGAVHEQLSCIVILESFFNILNRVSIDSTDIKVDFELLLRCILGIEYEVKTLDSLANNMEYNVVIRLINSSIFDMDKLDYIIRDSFFTGIGTPTIDTQRLFRNMYLSERYTLIFTSKAVPVLQSMIEARDNLYMYVYNHHTAVFSDFMFSYIQRRMDHNTRALYRLLYPTLQSKNKNFMYQLAEFPISRQGLVPQYYLFSASAIIEGNRSDSDWISLINVIFIAAKEIEDYSNIKLELDAIIDDEKVDLITSPDGKHQGKMFSLDVRFKGKKKNCSKEVFIPWEEPTDNQRKELAQQIKRTYLLVTRYRSRQFLKPWWKTIFEFENFMDRHFYDDSLRKQLCGFIYRGGEYGMPASEFRSQLAKHVKYVMQQLYHAKVLCANLEDDDFFIVERSVRFFDVDTIEHLDIALRTNEIVGKATESANQKSAQEYYIKNLTHIIPQKDYSALYGDWSFYIYSRDISCDGRKKYSVEELQKFNQTVEQVFVFTAKEFLRRGEQDFISRFCSRNNVDDGEKESMNELFECYRSKFPSAFTPERRTSK